MRQVLLGTHGVTVEDVPVPEVAIGSLLVRVTYSCVSTGTEMAALGQQRSPLWQRALKEPGRLSQALGVARQHGLSGLRQVVESKLSALYALGYSATGAVMATGTGITDFRPGDSVACAGSQWAHHAEVICVPRNLIAKVPDGVDSQVAATTTMGAIALQGVRRAAPTLGESFLVIGLGALGQLTAQLLAANGCRVIGLDLDRSRVELARSLGMASSVDPDLGDVIDQVHRITDGMGADGAIITAGSPSHEIVATAFRACRRKGRVVVVGDVGLHLNRADVYEKEIDFLVSCSYGPGRYDSRYEQDGVDYPVGYVRWTENRNMQAYLALVAAGRLDVAPLIGAVYPVEKAPQAYEDLSVGNQRPIIALLSYSQDPVASYPQEPVARDVSPVRRARGFAAGELGIAVIGAGAYACQVHLPNLQSYKRVKLVALVSRASHRAAAAGQRFGALRVTTDYRDVIADPDVNAVIIATRHDSHAKIALAALSAGKHVLVEKPLALAGDDTDALENFFSRDADADFPLLMTGFNRRFSPAGIRLRELVATRQGPLVLRYCMNAGYIPLNHWVHGPEGGGRNRGEACHIYDFFTFLAGSRVTRVTASCAQPVTAHYSRTDNFVASVEFQDGSVATLTYTALGSPDHPKERLEAFIDGRVIVMEDFQRLAVHGASLKGFDSRVVDKGQKALLKAFVNGCLAGGRWPIPLWEQIQATRIALEVEQYLAGERA